MSKNNYKFSIIVPIYNTDTKYLKKCINSIRKNNDFNKFEVLYINDCSNNKKTINFINKIKLNNNEKIIHNKQNIGLGPTRNVGIHHAKGKYLFFLDSDDWLELENFNEIFETLENKNLDFISFNFKFVEKDKEFINKKYFLKVNNKKYYGCTTCSKIYLKDYLLKNKIFFDNSKYVHEDEYFNMLLLLYNPNWISNSKILFSYNRLNQSSITSLSSFQKSLKAMIYFSNKLESIIDEKVEDVNDLPNDFREYAIVWCLWSLIQIKKNHLSYSEYKDIEDKFKFWRKIWKPNTFIQKIFKKIYCLPIINYLIYLLFKLDDFR